MTPGASPLTQGPDLLTASEVCAIFRVSRQTVTKWVRRGDLPAIQVRPRTTLRFRREDVSRLLEPRIVDSDDTHDQATA